MSINLLELLKEHLSGDVISNLGSLIGESPKNTESAVNCAIPSLLAELIGQSENMQGLSKLYALLTEGKHDGGILSNLGALSRGGEETTKLTAEGGHLLTSLMGNKASGMTEMLTQASGISNSASSSLLGFIMPVVLGFIGKRLKIEHIDSASGLAGLLGNQKEFFPKTSTDSPADVVSLDDDDIIVEAKSTPISDTLSNMGHAVEETVEDTLSAAKNMAENVGDTASALGSQVASEAKDFAHNAIEAIEEGAGEGKKFLPWILLAAAIALMWGLLKNCTVPEAPTDASAPVGTDTPVTQVEPAPTTPPPKPVAAPQEPVKAEPIPAAESTGDFFEKQLSTGYTIKAAKEGFESKLIRFIESSDPIDKNLWFTMDGIQFDTNKATIRTESAQQIEHIAEILKAFPKVKIKIGGYTDNTGNAKVNLKLSNNRAIAIKNAITPKGITADRLDGEGYGSDHPIASNATEEGRQQNRRIAVRVTEK